MTLISLVLSVRRLSRVSRIQAPNAGFIAPGLRPEHFQWRIRNLPYPADVYSVLVFDSSEGLSEIHFVLGIVYVFRFVTAVQVLQWSL